MNVRLVLELCMKAREATPVSRFAWIHAQLLDGASAAGYETVQISTGERPFCLLPVLICTVGVYCLLL
jgi:hypothetical protein